MEEGESQLRLLKPPFFTAAAAASADGGAGVSQLRPSYTFYSNLKL